MSRSEAENPFALLAYGTLSDRRRHWLVFRTFNYYRLALIGLLLTVYVVDDGNRLLDVDDRNLFTATSLSYLGLVLLGLVTNLWRRPSFLLQIHVQALVDIVVLSLLAYASGGLDSNLLVLLVVAVAASAIMLPLVSTFIAATLTTLAVATLWAYPHWNNLARSFPEIDLNTHGTAIVRLGVYTAAIFTSVLITFTMARRTRHSETLARRRSEELLELAQLNQAIVQHLQSGVVVVDRYANIRMMNSTARDLLNFHEPLESTPLGLVSPPLAQRLSQWLSSDNNNAQPFRPANHMPDLTPYFSYLGDAPQNADTLVILEDSSQVEQRVQQIKLVALGRLTASIAHEIRNPLASIHHAAQLLEESSSAGIADKRLAHIVHENAKRASTIITNVLDLSRRERARPEDFELRPWLEEFCEEFLRGYSGTRPTLEVRVYPKDLTVRFDIGHFHQILWNLVSNACTHGARSEEEPPRVRLHAGRDSRSQRPLLDVIDDGAGIPEEDREKIFEPFFTTKTQGHGLGLYISREICEANRGQLQYLRTAEGSSCFRITFASAGASAVDKLRLSNA